MERPVCGLREAALCLCVISELRDRPGALGQSDLSGADQGPVEQGQHIIPQTSFSSSQGALPPLPVSPTQNVTYLEIASLQR